MVDKDGTSVGGSRMERKNLNSGKLASTAPRVLLTDTTRWALAARLAIGLSKLGCSVSAVCPTRGHPIAKTRAFQQLFRYNGLRPLDSLTAAVREFEPEIIIPCDDRGVQHLHELYVHARRSGGAGSNIMTLIERSLGSPASYPVVSGRHDLLVIAREEGLCVPDTRLVNTLDDLKAWLVAQPLPWVLKADGTWGGGGVKIAHSLEEAETSFLDLTRLFSFRRAIRRFSVNRDSFWLRPWWNGLKPQVIIQAYIHGRPANCAVFCWEGKILAGIGVEVVSAEGLTGPASVVRVIDNPEMKRAAERIASRLGLSGFFGLDFMIDDDSGDTYLIEMNPRCAPPCHLQLGKGRDLIGALCAQLSGQPLQHTLPATTNRMIAYFPQAWNCQSEFLQSSFQDAPWGEPDLVQELLRPWPNRSLLFRLSNHFRTLKTFTTAFLASRSSDYGE
jgi:hypothetical protein